VVAEGIHPASPRNEP